jgi:hypothetical protein
MAAQKIKDLAVKVSEYTDKTGAKKGRWQNVGAVMQSDDGSKFIMLARWFNPAGVQDLSGKGGESLLLSMFDPKDDKQDQPRSTGQEPARTTGQQNQKSLDDGADDDIPF